MPVSDQLGHRYAHAAMEAVDGVGRRGDHACTMPGEDDRRVSSEWPRETVIATSTSVNAGAKALQDRVSTVGRMMLQFVRIAVALALLLAVALEVDAVAAFLLLRGYR